MRKERLSKRQDLGDKLDNFLSSLAHSGLSQPDSRLNDVLEPLVSNQENSFALQK